MARIIAIGDIHGCSNTFQKLLLEKINIQKSDEVYCVGDYVDRGKDSKSVIDIILKLRKEGFIIHTIRGNHEQMMMESTEDSKRLYLWLMNGGNETLKSFGVSSVNELPQAYITFLKETKYYIATDQYIFVHAGLNFHRDDPFEDKEEMLWTRDAYFDKSKIRNRILIHGHTPTPLKSISEQLNTNKINIDAGCVYGNRNGYGYLAGLLLPQRELIVQKNID
jgi:serine/threonine protein phosphatase 1